MEEMKGRDQSYKCELITDLDETEYTFFENGPFFDLCKGPHVNHTGEIGPIKLLRVSGAYWRGDESKNMLQRIYGTAFHTKKPWICIWNSWKKLKNVIIEY